MIVFVLLAALIVLVAVTFISVEKIGIPHALTHEGAKVRRATRLGELDAMKG